MISDVQDKLLSGLHNQIKAQSLHLQNFAH